ncbi:MAG: YfbR-like 5'-deoxynucleotidase, partial [Christensenellaceae bacterium]
MKKSFYAYMSRLKHIKRWGLMRNTIEENVQEHSFHVALISHALCI